MCGLGYALVVLVSAYKYFIYLRFKKSLTNLTKCIFLCRYAQYGEVSPKIDIYAFGVVLYELISGKEAIIKTNETVNESKGLVALVVFPVLS